MGGNKGLKQGRGEVSVRPITRQREGNISCGKKVNRGESNRNDNLNESNTAAHRYRKKRTAGARCPGGGKKAEGERREKKAKSQSVKGAQVTPREEVLGRLRAKKGKWGASLQTKG